MKRPMLVALVLTLVACGSWDDNRGGPGGVTEAIEARGHAPYWGGACRILTGYREILCPWRRGGGLRLRARRADFRVSSSEKQTP